MFTKIKNRKPKQDNMQGKAIKSVGTDNVSIYVFAATGYFILNQQKPGAVRWFISIQTTVNSIL